MGIIFHRNCYYINPKEQNLDSKSNIVYIHSVNLRRNNFINEDNIIDIKKQNSINEEINEKEIIKEKEEKKRKKEDKWKFKLNKINKED